MRTFTREDCNQSDKQMLLYQRVIVYDREKLAEQSSGQLFLCVEPDRAKLQLDKIDLISLSDGEWRIGRREGVLGTLKPELLPEEAKLHLSQICKRRRGESEPEGTCFYGYSFLPDGRYAAAVRLGSVQEVMDYVELQKPYQYRILICDSEDLAVMELVEGQIVFPSQEQMEASLGGGGAAKGRRDRDEVRRKAP